jgi:hypothetical protein
VYFDFYYYQKVLAYTWAQKQWPGRRKMLFKLLLLVPLATVFHAICFLLDYVFFPALWKQQVKAPVFVVGHARSGTTLIHRLLAADGDRFSYFLYWEMFFPALTQRYMIRAIGWFDRTCLSQRILKRLQAWDDKTFGPMRHIHNMGLWIAEEDQFVMNSAFVTQQWSLDLPLMDEVDIFHIDQLSARRRRKWMRHYKQCVKRQLLINGGNKTHLSKNPVMSGWVNALIETFPDAKIVVNVRDPLQCIPSTLKLMEMSWKKGKWARADYQASLDALTQISFDCYHLPKAALQQHPQTPHYFVDYRELTAAPGATVEAVYSAIGLDISASYQAYLQSQEQAEKAHKSAFKYTIKDYAITPMEIEAQLEDFYQQYRWPRYRPQGDA